MKTIRIFALAGLLSCAVASLAGAAGISLEVGAVGYDFNAGGSDQKATNPQPITSSAMLTPDLYFNAGYTMPLDDMTKLKLGLMAEDAMGTGSSSFVNMGRFEPYADLSWGALSARVSFPMYLLGYDTTNDPSANELKYIVDKLYKGINLGTYYGAGTTKGDTLLFTNYENVAYKLSLDKTTAFVFSASTEITLSPSVWLNDVKPQVTFIYGPFQLDLKESIYFSDQGKDPSTSDTAYNLRFFTDPKLTFNFASLGVNGLKAYLAASLYTYNSYPNSSLSDDAVFYGKSNKPTGSAVALGSSITPGVSCSFGPFYAELALKYSNYDDKVSNDAGKDPTFDPSLKISYTLSF
jgi:hypothetical protein